MQERSKFCFTHPLGKDIYLYSLRNDTETEVLLTNYGGILVAYKIRMPDKSTNDIVLGFDHVEDYLKADYLQHYPYFGAAIGRYANRIKNASFMLDGKKVNVAKNLGDHQLHGGFDGFDKKPWETLSFDEKNNILELQYTSVDGEEGFPGNVDVHLVFELTDSNDLIYTYSATTDQATAINLTHHSYFNLNNGKGTIDDHQVKIYSDKILEQDNNLATTGNFIAVDNTKYDFREFRPLDAIANEGYDQTFDLNKSAATLSMAAEVYSPESGLVLQVLTTEPVVHLYTGQGIQEMNGKNGLKYTSYSGLCLETQKHPNAINIPKFPNTILKPGEKYHQENVYKICFPEK